MGDRTNVELMLKTNVYENDKELQDLVESWSGETFDVSKETDTEHSLTFILFYDINYGNMPDLEEYLQAENIEYKLSHGHGDEYGEGYTYRYLDENGDMCTVEDYQDFTYVTENKVLFMIENMIEEGATTNDILRFINKRQFLNNPPMFNRK